MASVRLKIDSAKFNHISSRTKETENNSLPCLSRERGEISIYFDITRLRRNAIYHSGNYTLLAASWKRICLNSRGALYVKSQTCLWERDFINDDPSKAKPYRPCCHKLSSRYLEGFSLSTDCLSQQKLSRECRLKLLKNPFPRFLPSGGRNRFTAINNNDSTTLQWL